MAHFPVGSRPSTSPADSCILQWIISGRIRQVESDFNIHGSWVRSSKERGITIWLAKAMIGFTFPGKGIVLLDAGAINTLNSADILKIVATVAERCILTLFGG